MRVSVINVENLTVLHIVVFCFQKQVFEEKMAKMDSLLQSELETIREQHSRLQV